MTAIRVTSARHALEQLSAATFSAIQSPCSNHTVANHINHHLYTHACDFYQWYDREANAIQYRYQCDTAVILNIFWSARHRVTSLGYTLARPVPVPAPFHSVARLQPIQT